MAKVLKGISGLWGFGKVEIAEEGLHIVAVDNLVRGRKLTYYINYNKENKINDEKKLEEGLKRQNIEKKKIVPKGIIFGEKVLFFPYLSHIFHAPLWENHYHKGHGISLHVKFGDWVNQGDVIYSIIFYGKPDFPMFQWRGKEVKIEIKSPVSGLVISNINSANNRIVRYDKAHVIHELAILLPEYQAPIYSRAEVLEPLFTSFYQLRKFFYQDDVLKYYQSDENLTGKFDKEKSKNYEFMNFFEYNKQCASYAFYEHKMPSKEYFDYYWDEYNKSYLIPLFQNIYDSEKWHN